jgi:hypothetical protein
MERKENTMPYLEPGQPMPDEDMFLDPCDTPREGWAIGDPEQEEDPFRAAGLRHVAESVARHDDPSYWPEDTNENPPVRG